MAKAAPGQATVTAKRGGSNVEKSATVEVVLNQIKSLSMSPAIIAQGASSTGTVTLDMPAPSAGVIVNLSSSNSVVKVPPSAWVKKGDTTATFPATAESGSGGSGKKTAQAARITAVTSGMGGVAKDAALIVKAQ